MTLVENITERSIQQLQTDGGGEYNSNAFREYCQNKGIRHRKSTPNTPQQNGIAERKNRSLLNTARSMINAANLDSKFWEEAIATACYLQNRTYHKSIGLSTPYELWYGQKLHIKDLKVFGCPAYAYVTEKNRKKMDKRATKTIFVGYGDAHGYKAYRLYNSTSNQFLFSRSVTFDESTILNNHTKPMTTNNIKQDNHEQRKAETESIITWRIPFSRHILNNTSNNNPNQIPTDSKSLAKAEQSRRNFHKTTNLLSSATSSPTDDQSEPSATQPHIQTQGNTPAKATLQRPKMSCKSVHTQLSHRAHTPAKSTSKRPIISCKSVRIPLNRGARSVTRSMIRSAPRMLNHSAFISPDQSHISEPFPSSSRNSIATPLKALRNSRFTHTNYQKNLVSPIF